MNKETFIDILFNSSAVFVDWNNDEYLVRDLMDKAYKARHDDVKLTETENHIQCFVELMSAELGGGSLVRGKVLPDSKPSSTYSSYTSGSTGQPKLVSHNLENFIAPGVAGAVTENMNEGSVFLEYRPTFTNAIFGIGMFPGAIANSKVVFRKFNPFTVPAEFNLYRPTHTHLTPTSYSAVSKTKEWKNVDLRTCEYFLSGSNFTSTGFFEDIKSKGGRPTNGYGATEMPAIMCAYPNSEFHLGKVWYPGAEWKEVDGELWCRWNHMDWWASGDMIEVDPVHGPRIIGRKDNQFKFNDYKIVPEQYESIVKQHSKVSDAMLKLEKQLILYYEGSADPSELEELLLKYNTPETMPKRFMSVKALPRNPFGKLDRHGKILTK